MPSEVESPMWATERQDVRRPPAPAGEGLFPVPADWSLSELAPWVLAGAGLGAAGRAEPAASELGLAVAGTGTKPASPAQATASTATEPVAAATVPAAPGRARRPAAPRILPAAPRPVLLRPMSPRPPSLARAQALARAPCRMGS